MRCAASRRGGRPGACAPGSWGAASFRLLKNTGVLDLASFNIQVLQAPGQRTKNFPQRERAPIHYHPCPSPRAAAERWRSLQCSLRQCSLWGLGPGFPIGDQQAPLIASLSSSVSRGQQMPGRVELTAAGTVAGDLPRISGHQVCVSIFHASLPVVPAPTRREALFSPLLTRDKVARLTDGPAWVRFPVEPGQHPRRAFHRVGATPNALGEDMRPR